MPPQSRALRAAVGLAGGLLLLTGCRQGDVPLTYQPAVGDRSAFEVRVRSSSVVRLPGRPARREKDEILLRADHTVLAVDRSGIQVRVRLRDARDPEGGSRTFVVRLDRAAQLAEVQEVEGLPARVLGELGLPEIFPAAAQLPRSRLAPGDRWAIDEPVELPDAETGRLVGRGRLVELGVEGRRPVATVETETRLPISRRRADDQDGVIDLRGVQLTESETTHRIADGSVERSRSRTVATFELLLAPPPGTAPGARPLEGRLEVEVRSTTRRLG